MRSHSTVIAPFTCFFRFIAAKRVDFGAQSREIRLGVLELTMQKQFLGQRVRVVSVVLAFAAAALVGCASQQGGPGGRGGPEGDGGPGGGSGRGGERGAFVSPIEQIQEQLADTAQELNLTPKQAVLWDNYQASVAALMADQLKHSAYAASSSRTAVQQINAKVDVVRNRLAAMEEVAEKASALYQSLDETQKRIADQRLAATVPALYSGLVVQSGDGGRSAAQGTTGRSGRGGMRGGSGGGMGGGRF